MVVKVIKTIDINEIPEKEHAKDIEYYLKRVNEKLSNVKITSTYEKINGTFESCHKLTSVIVWNDND